MALYAAVSIAKRRYGYAQARTSGSNLDLLKETAKKAQLWAYSEP